MQFTVSHAAEGNCLGNDSATLKITISCNVRFEEEFGRNGRNDIIEVAEKPIE